MARYILVVAPALLDPDACYRALRARDRRFDGAFFVAVHSTGIYCRPVCPARPVAADRCTFFVRAAEAEREGYRACFRCRPELAPGLAPMDSLPRLVRRAAAEIDAGALDDHGVEELAAKLGVTSRHLRRAMERELGVSPIEYAQTRRLALAKRLLHDTTLPLAEIAFVAGFGSVRRFNALFQKSFARAPSAVRLRRLARPARRGEVVSDTITLRLDYRPPLAWESLLSFLGGRAIPGVEAIDGGGAGGGEYRRSVRIGDHVGWLSVRRAAGDEPALLASVSMSLLPRLTTVVADDRSDSDSAVRSL